MNTTISLNLKALKNVAIIDVKGKTGVKRCVAIPIDDNDLYVSERGAYLNLVAWENGKLKDGKTHLVKQSFSKKFRDTMTDEEKKKQPILGDVKPISAPSNDLPLAAPSDDLPF